MKKPLFLILSLKRLCLTAEHLDDVWFEYTIASESSLEKV
jgi:hypothetical protein